MVPGAVGGVQNMTVQEPELTDTNAAVVVDDPFEASRPGAASMIVFDAVTKVY
jgi:hypothetical protein